MCAMWPSAPGASATPNDEASGPRLTIDVLVCAVILVLGAMHFALVLRSSDFFTGDTIYFELARSILARTGYAFNSTPETVLPPGFPAIMALVCVTIGCGYTVFVRCIVVFSTLGLLASYALIRREEGRLAAAVVTLLLVSSPVWFGLETRLVFSDLPYLLTSMLTLLLVSRLDKETVPRRRAVTWLLCTMALIGSLLIRSAGIALLLGLLAWLAISWVTDRPARVRRLKLFLPLLIVAVPVEGVWMRWAGTHQVLEWPIGGYPRSYVSQLSVKNGNDPELGSATLADIPARVAHNLNDHVVGFLSLLTRQQYINPGWASPLILGSLILIFVGLAGSIWPSGGQVTEWYFIATEAIYLVWPWNLEMRFLLPVAPLAGLYLWRGGELLVRWAMRSPQSAVAWVAPISLLAAVVAGASAARSGSRQLTLAVVFWIALAGLVLVAARMGPRRLRSLGERLCRPMLTVPWMRTRLSAALAFCVLAVGAQAGIGIAQQLELGRENISFDLTTRSSFSDVEAGEWLGAHTDTHAVVMAREVDVVYHYSRRRVVWFPPISEPKTLMDGIHKYGVEFVVVNDRSWSYWQPLEEDCFAALIKAYPTSFRLVEASPRLQIFEVLDPSTRAGVDGARHAE
jgi:hypothetical protein